MTDDFKMEDFLVDSNKGPKDVKTSIRNKYNRRLKNLTYILEDFIHHAELRLDKSKAGNIHKREETEKLLEASKQLFDLLPCISESEPSLNDDFLFNILGIQQEPEDSKDQETPETASDII